MAAYNPDEVNLKLAKAKEIIRELLTLVNFLNEGNVKEHLVEKAEAFIKKAEQNDKH